MPGSGPKVLWTPREVGLRKRLERGETLVVNPQTDRALVRWAEKRGLLVWLDANSDWGHISTPGQTSSQEEVFAAFVVYFALKRTLQKQIASLKGKALACREALPGRHTDFLVSMVEGGAESVEQMLGVANRFSNEDLNHLVAWAEARLDKPRSRQPRANKSPASPGRKRRQPP